MWELTVQFWMSLVQAACTTTMRLYQESAGNSNLDNRIVRTDLGAIRKYGMLDFGHQYWEEATEFGASDISANFLYYYYLF